MAQQGTMPLNPSSGRAPPSHTHRLRQMGVREGSVITRLVARLTRQISMDSTGLPSTLLGQSLH